jgi:hypothetical protein
MLDQGAESAVQRLAVHSEWRSHVLLAKNAESQLGYADIWQHPLPNTLDSRNFLHSNLAFVL